MNEKELYKWFAWFFQFHSSYLIFEKSGSYHITCEKWCLIFNIIENIIISQWKDLTGNRIYVPSLKYDASINFPTGYWIVQ